MIVRMLPAALAPLVVALLVAPAGAAGPRLVAHGTGPEPPLLLRGRAGWQLDHAGRTTAVALPGGTEVDSVTALADGCLIAGTQLDGDRRELALWLVGADGPRPQPLPARGSGRHRVRPVPIAAGGALAGLAWLEGDSRETFAVRWSAWSAAGFGTPVEIAPPGPGSQLALAGARLGDGRNLLVWAGFDGGDDEIWASLGDGSSWSAPVRVGADNQVPDITPAVVAAPGGGALVAWSRFDGSEYRVTVARLAGAAFRELAGAAPPGTLYPSFESAARSLLWWDARGDAWSLAELTADEQVVERGRAAGAVDERPAATLLPDRVRFRFGDRSVDAPRR